VAQVHAINTLFTHLWSIVESYSCDESAFYHCGSIISLTNDKSCKAIARTCLAKAKDLTLKAKAKDLTFKAKAKDSKFVLEDSSRPRTKAKDNNTGTQA